MRTRKYVTAALVAAGAIVVAGTAHAQSTKGSGKFQATIQSKPVASIAGKPPTGGASTALKLAKDLGDPLKPGYGPGEYVLQIETSSSPTGNVDVSAFVTLTVDAAGKCTVHAADSVDGDGNNDTCGGVGEPLCAPDAVGKCTFTVYQAAGNPIYLGGPGDGQPTAARIRIRQNVDTVNCNTGDIILAGTEVPPTSTCSDGAVVGVVGVANGDITP
jgi:hypothetical protein